MARSTLDETLIRAAARVSDWHAAHDGVIAENAAAQPPAHGGTTPVHAPDRQHASGADSAPMQDLLPAG